MTEPVDTSRTYALFTLENVRNAALLRAEQVFQISADGARAAYVPGTSDSAYAAAIAAAISTKTTAVVAAHAALSSGRSAVHR